jgi:hypothetical protein
MPVDATIMVLVHFILLKNNGAAKSAPCHYPLLCYYLEKIDCCSVVMLFGYIFCFMLEDCDTETAPRWQVVDFEEGIFFQENKRSKQAPCRFSCEEAHSHS